MLVAICAMCFGAASADAAQATHIFNIAGVTREGTDMLQAVTNNQTSVIVRDANGDPLRDTSNNVVRSATDACPLATYPTRRCVNVQAFEMVQGTGTDGVTRRLYYMWTNGITGAKPGYIHISDLKSSPTLDISKVKGNGATSGHAAPADAPGSPQYVLTPADMGNKDMWYWPETCPNSEHCSYTRYGRPFDNANAAMMVWSWPHKSTDERLDGGGVARGIFSAGQIFHPSDVDPIQLPTFPPAASEAASRAAGPNGSVTARFGWVRTTFGTKLYGWMTTKHVYYGVCVNHMTYSIGTPVAGMVCS